MPEDLHDYAYGAVKAGVSAGDYLALTDDGGGYRTHMANDAGGFHSMLPMYRVKFLYAEILSGAQPVDVAGRGDAGGAGVLDAAVRRHCAALAALGGALALAPVIAAALIVAEFAYVARSNTPDLLASALLLGGLYAHVRRREAATAMLLLLAVMARPDNVIFVGVFAVLLLAFRQWSVGVLAARSPPLPPISRSRTGPGIPAGGRISISRASSSR